MGDESQTQKHYDYLSEMLKDARLAEAQRLRDAVDLSVDGRQIQFPDESFGAVLVSYIEGPLRRDVLREAKRVLKKGGYLIWQGGFGIRTDMSDITNLGFDPLQVRVTFVDAQRAGDAGLMGPYPVFEPIMVQKPFNH